MVLSCLKAWSMDYTFRQDKGLELTWQTDDKVGITTGNVNYGTTEQLCFWASSAASATRNDRALYAVGYQLKQSTTYYSYSPYRWVEAFDARNITCYYDNQVQNGNGSTKALAQYDYQMATATTSSTACQIPFSHIGGILRVSFTAQTAMNIKAMNIKAQTPLIATQTVMDIVNQRVTPNQHSLAMTLKTDNTNIAKGERVILYLACPAQDLSAITLDITITDDRNNEQSIAKIKGPNIRSGYLYNIDIDNATQTAAKAAQTFNNARPEITATGIANPIARTSDILIDNTYTVQLVQQTKKGDVNGDGDVDVLDAIAIVGYYTKGRTAELSPAVCDMNGDGDIDVLDAIEIVGRYTKGQK